MDSKIYYSRAKQTLDPASYTHPQANETVLDLVGRLLLEKKKKTVNTSEHTSVSAPRTPRCLTPSPLA
ncbi:hypothetical protein, partial [Aeromonas caviae]|uniref:hypothetical protein n=1 Tax=Aeromonas caviae TaxID=648 RepID=UPI0025B68718